MRATTTDDPSVGDYIQDRTQKWWKVVGKQAGWFRLQDQDGRLVSQQGLPPVPTLKWEMEDALKVLKDMLGAVVVHDSANTRRASDGT